jgi:hypothetical protein
MLTLVARPSREVGEGFPTCSGNISRGLSLSVGLTSMVIEALPLPEDSPSALTLETQGVTLGEGRT